MRSWSRLLPFCISRLKKFADGGTIEVEHLRASVEHLRENVNAASLHLPPETVAELNAVGANKA